MTLWRLDVDQDVYSYVLPVDLADRRYFWFSDSVPRAGSWSPPMLQWERDSSYLLPDISCIVTSSPIVSRRALEVLTPLIGAAVEFLPLPPPADEFALVHVMDIVDCLDHARSKVSRFSDGRVSGILHYSFDVEKLCGKHMFKIPEMVALEVFVSDTFRATVESHGLTGAIFRPVP